MKNIKEDESKLTGILMCYKFFQPLSNTLFNKLVNKAISKMSTQQREIKKENPFVGLTDKFDYLQNQVDNITRMFAARLEE
jgi:hypothetical protein